MLTASGEILEIVKRQRIVCSRDLAARGIAREHLFRLLRKGALTRATRGICVLAVAPVTELHGLALVAKQAPNAVVCLLSVLQFNGLTTQQPHAVWSAVEVKAHRPKIGCPPMHAVRFSGAALREGVENHRIEEVPVRSMASPRPSPITLSTEVIGIDRAIEALLDGLRKRVSVDESYRFAKICRVANVIRPHLESTA
jgi:predicted transcriptional regulator of viral defense system